MTLISNDSITAVGPYYQSQLDSGDWVVDSTDYVKGTIHFHRRSRPKTAGTVEPHRLGQQTEILVVLYS